MVRCGRYTRLFPNNMLNDREMLVISHLQHKDHKRVLLCINDNPGITNQELADMLGMKKNAMHQYLGVFLGDDLIRYKDDGMHKRYFIKADVREMFKHYR